MGIIYHGGLSISVRCLKTFLFSSQGSRLWIVITARGAL